MNSKARICINCGAPSEEKDRFCGECGQPLEKAPSPGERGSEKGPATVEDGFGEGPAAGSKKRIFLPKLLVVGLVVLVMLGLGAWAGYKWVISRPVHIDTTQLLPQAGSGAQPQRGTEQQQPAPDGTGRRARGWLGVSAQDVPWELASRIGMAAPSGTLVNGCEPGGPADRAGIMPGDVLLEMNGVQLAGADDLKKRIAEELPGRTVELVVWRNGSAYRASVLVAERTPNLERQKRMEARQYGSAYEACFARYCPGCNNPLDLFKEQTQECRQCEAVNKSQIEDCAAYGQP